MSDSRRLLPLVIYDTSSILAVFKEKVNTLRQVYSIVGPHVPAVLLSTIRELRELSFRRERATSRAAELALRVLVPRFSVICCEESRPVDEALVDVVERLVSKCYNVVVVTCDLELRRRLELRGVRVIYLRKCKFFTTEE